MSLAEKRRNLFGILVVVAILMVLFGAGLVESIGSESNKVTVPEIQPGQTVKIIYKIPEIKTPSGNLTPITTEAIQEQEPISITPEEPVIEEGLRLVSKEGTAPYNETLEISNTIIKNDKEVTFTPVDIEARGYYKCNESSFCQQAEYTIKICDTEKKDFEINHTKGDLLNRVFSKFPIIYSGINVDKKFIVYKNISYIVNKTLVGIEDIEKPEPISIIEINETIVEEYKSLDNCITLTPSFLVPYPSSDKFDWCGILFGEEYCIDPYWNTTSQTDWDAGTHNYTMSNTTGILTNTRFEMNNTWTNITKAGVIGYWKLDDRATNITIDETGKNNGTMPAGDFIHYVSSVNTSYGNAIVLDGVNDYVNVGNASSLNNINSTFTLSAWIKLSATGENTIAAKRNTAPYWHWRISGGCMRILLSNSTTLDNLVSTSCTYNNSAWHYVAVTRDGNSITFYKDGVSDGTATSDKDVVNNANFLIIGAYNNNGNDYLFNGTIDNVVIYNRTLSAAEILAHNLTGNFSSNDPYAVGAWDMDDNNCVYGQCQNTVSTKEEDESGKGNNGFLRDRRPRVLQSGTVGNATNGAMDFGGSSSANVYFTIPNTDLFNFEASESWSFMTWLKSVDTGDDYQNIFYKGAGNPLNILDMRFTGTMRWQYRDTAGTIITATPCTNMDNGNWHHFAMSVNRTDNVTIFWCDGVQDVTLANISLVVNTSNSDKMYIGNDYSPTGAFNGTLDQMIFFNRTLSGAEVRELAGYSPNGQYISAINDSTFTMANWSNVTCSANFNNTFGSQNVSVQVRGCDDAACSGEVWNSNWLDCTNKTLPTNGTIIGRYGQYKALFENANETAPFVVNVSVGYEFDATNPNITGINYTTVEGSVGTYIPYGETMDKIEVVVSDSSSVSVAVTVYDPSLNKDVNNQSMSLLTGITYQYGTNFNLDEAGNWTIVVNATDSAGNVNSSNSSFVVLAAEVGVSHGWFGYDTRTIPDNANLTNLGGYSFDSIGILVNFSNIGANYSSMMTQINQTKEKINARVQLEFLFDGNFSNGTYINNTNYNITTYLYNLSKWPYYDIVERLIIELQNDSTNIYNNSDLVAFTNNISREIKNITSSQFVIYVKNLSASSLDTSYVSTYTTYESTETQGELSNTTKGLVLLLHLNNNSAAGENSSWFYDWSGQGNNGTCTVTQNCPVLNLTGRFGNASEFNGSGMFISVADDNSLEGMANLTVELWFKSSLNTQSNRLINKGGAGSSADWLIEQRGGTTYWWQVRNSTEGYKFVSFTASDNAWHHIAGVYNGTDVFAYIDGVKTSASSLGGNISTSTANLGIGANPNGVSAFNGTIDEVAVYNRTLTATEIEEHYVQFKQRFLNDEISRFNKSNSLNRFYWNLTSFNKQYTEDYYNNLIKIMRGDIDLNSNINETNAFELTNDDIVVFNNKSETVNYTLNVSVASGGTVTKELFTVNSTTCCSWMTNATATVEKSDALVEWTSANVPEIRAWTFNETISNDVSITSVTAICQVEWDAANGIEFLFNTSETQNWDSANCNISAASGGVQYTCDLKVEGVNTPAEVNSLDISCKNINNGAYWALDYQHVAVQYATTATTTPRQNRDIWDVVSDTYIEENSNDNISVNIEPYSYALLYFDDFDHILYANNTKQELYTQSANKSYLWEYDDGSETYNLTLKGNQDIKVELWDGSFTANKTFFLDYATIDAFVYRDFTQACRNGIIIIADTDSDAINNTIGCHKSTYGYVSAADYADTNAWEVMKTEECRNWTNYYNISVFLDGIDYAATKTNMETRIKRIADNVTGAGYKIIFNDYTSYEEVSAYGSMDMKESCFSTWSCNKSQVNPVASYEYGKLCTNWTTYEAYCVGNWSVANACNVANQYAVNWSFGDFNLDKNRSDWAMKHDKQQLCFAYGDRDDYTKASYDYAAFLVMYGHSIGNRSNYFLYGQANFQLMPEQYYIDVGAMLEKDYTQDSGDANHYYRGYEKGTVHIWTNNYTWWFDDGITIGSMQLCVRAVNKSADNLTIRINENNSQVYNISGSVYGENCKGLNTTNYAEYGYYTVEAYVDGRTANKNWTIGVDTLSKSGSHSWNDSSTQTQQFDEAPDWNISRHLYRLTLNDNYMFSLEINKTEKRAIHTFATITRTESAIVFVTNITLSTLKKYPLKIWDVGVTIYNTAIGAFRALVNNVWEMLSPGTTMDCNSDNPSWILTTMPDGTVWGSCKQQVTGGWFYRFFAPSLSDQKAQLIEPPNVYLIKPANKSSSTEAFNKFDYNVSCYDSIVNCSLIADNKYIKNTTTVTKDDPQEIIGKLGDGTHEWFIRCVDNVNLSSDSEVRTINVNIVTVVTPAPEPTSGGGVSGGSTVIGKLYMFPTLIPGQPLRQTSNIMGYPITALTVAVLNKADGVQIKVKQEKGSGISIPEYAVYRYFTVTPTNLPNENIEKIIIDFKVDKNWLFTRGLKADSVVLRHYKADRWEKIDTKQIGADAFYYYFTSELKELSAFAITVGMSPEKLAQVEEELGLEKVPEEIKEEKEEVMPEEKAEVVKVEKKASGLDLLIFGLILLMIILAMWKFRKRKR